MSFGWKWDLVKGIPLHKNYYFLMDCCLKILNQFTIKLKQLLRFRILFSVRGVKNRGTVYSYRATRSPTNKRRSEKREWHKPRSSQKGGETPRGYFTRKNVNK